MKKCTVYIDESGDLGCKKGTRWFVITAVIVEEEKESEASKIIERLKNELKVKEIHIKKIQDFYKRSFIAKELNNADFTYINVIADTSKLDLSKIDSANICYNYMCRYLLERVSWFLKEENRTADVVLSSRNEKRDNELIKYITEKLIPCKNEIKSEYFNNFYAELSQKSDLLQLADVCATTTFLAHEEKEWGMTTPCFYNVLKGHLYRYNGEVLQYGMKYFSDEMKLELEELNNRGPCSKK